MRDKNGANRGKCSKCSECDEYIKEKDFNLCAYCEHTPVAHGECTKHKLLFC